jgi:hypothetical protein
MPTPVLETAIRTAILTAPGVAAIVGDKVRPLVLAPGTARPYVTFHVTGRETMDTLADGPGEYRKAEFEVGILADTYDQMMALSDKIRDRLDGYGVAASSTSVEMDAEYDSETDVEQAIPEGRDVPVYLRVQTYKALYRSAAS